MDRRNKDRHNLRLICLADAGTAHSEPLEATTENMSRDGILMRWVDAVPLPVIGSALNVEVGLPASEFGARVMHCETTVIRITQRQNGGHAVGLRIDAVKFRPAANAPGKPVRSALKKSLNKSLANKSLLEMTPLTDKVS